MTIFRVQDANGRGPWKPGFSHKWVRENPDYDLVAWPVQFGVDLIRHASIAGMFVGYGCETVDQLRRWFDREEYAKLVALKHVAVKLEVGRILASSDIQCVFERSKPLNQDVEVFQLYDL